MNKKRILQQSFVLLMLVLTVMVYINLLFIRNTLRFNRILIDQSEYDSIISSRQEYKDDMIKSIQFNQTTLFDVADTNEYYYSLYVKDNKKYNPYIKFDSILNDINVSILNNHITKELIENNKHIKMLFYNDEYYKEYEIVVTTLPIMNISYEDSDENRIKVNSRYEDIHNDEFDSNIIGELSLYDNSINVIENSNLVFHVRGGTTTYFPKKGFKLSLKDKKENSINKNLLNMRNDDDWILYGVYDDQDRIRNVFSSRLWYDGCSFDNSYNINAGMYYKYIELFMNGKYHGLYALGFPIDKKQLKLSTNEYLYKKENWLPNSNSNYPFSYEIKSDNESYQLLSNYFKKVHTLSNDTLLSYIDINNNIDFYLFNLLVQNSDGANGMNSKNMFISFKSDQKGYKALYIPWDLDLTFGNAYVAPNNMVSFDDNSFIHKDSAIGKLVDNNNRRVIDMLKDKYHQLRNTVWSKENINRILDDYSNDIFNSGAYKRDITRWPNGIYENDLDSLNNFKNFVFERLNSMDDYINYL